MPDPQAHRDPPPLNAVFTALSDEKRRDMVARLSTGMKSVKELAEPLGMRMPSAVKHLALLEASGLVVSQKSGRVRTYAIKAAAFISIGRWIADREIALNAGFDGWNKPSLTSRRIPNDPSSPTHDLHN